MCPEVKPPSDSLSVLRKHVGLFSHANDSVAAGHLVLTSAACVLIPFALYARCPIIFAVPLVLVQGLFIVKAFIIFHDAGHGSFFSTKWMNYVAHQITGLLILSPPYWAATHTKHHAVSGNRDQELYAFNETIFHTVKEYHAMPRPLQAVYRVFRDPSIFYVCATCYKWFVYYRTPFIHNTEYPPMQLFVNTVAMVTWLWLMSLVSPIYVVWLLLGWIVGATGGIMLFHCEHSYNQP